MPPRIASLCLIVLGAGLGAGEAAPGGAGRHVVFIAGRNSHGYGSHDHYAGCMLLAKCLEHGLPGKVRTTVHKLWPQDPEAFKDADAVIIYCDGGNGHIINKNLAQMAPLMAKGVGLGCLHYGVEVPKGEVGDKFKEWIGGHFETHWSVNPHWTAKFEKFPDHPIARGMKPFAIKDEWYYHMRFRDGMKGVTPILSALPPPETLSRGDGPHSGNPHVRAAVLERKEPQHVMWACERDDGGRGFGFTGGHFHWNWAHDEFRKVALNAIAHIAKVEVPPEGVVTPTPTLEDMKANQDEKPPADFTKIQQLLDAFKAPPAAEAK